MRTRRKPPTVATARVVEFRWYEWRSRDGGRTAAHAFRIEGGERPPRALCRCSPGAGAGAVREVARPVERCGACLAFLAKVGRQSPPRAVPETRVSPVARADPRTFYAPLHSYDDFERELR